MAKITLYATGKRVNGHESVGVSAGGPDEEHWRSLGYAPKGEKQAPAAVDAGEGGEDGAWPLKMSPADYLDKYEGQDDLSDEVLERLELARNLVAAEG